MPENLQYQDDELFNRETQHEHSDVPVRPLWAAMAIFLVFAAVSHVVLWYLYKAFILSERKLDEAPQTAIARPAGAGVPQNQPLLQPFPKASAGTGPLPPNRTTPVQDLIEMRAAEDAILKHYGWVDEKNGVAHIPIDVAKDRAVTMLQGAAAAPAAADPAVAVPAQAPAGGPQQ